ncbi:2Fe-2S ferredoxin [Solimonas sp. K1W22B-7]|uniref:2Fe-2S iron-sulfur cluster-binding protein n=1 Tax=Solimonas sp. K1W22B-7 TaxID=2303331 RepID=UPI000E336057|nr:2Fe-2S iron-sulfur cluster-binding protein [Solimonas sp. K1W22B-7]AXQ30692.1 2Fe-2S ferredoxin [Solimonas sp. K1W22B-7]
MGIKLTFVQADGVEKTFEDVPTGQSLMEVGRFNNVEGILGDCGGSCACATCHVYVSAPWRAVVGEPDDIETSTLDMATDVLPGQSRLCCQIQLRDELDGLQVTVAPSF